MNLAFRLMVEGGTHPRGMSSTVVTPLSSNFDTSIVAAARIFYQANTACLTPSSTFLSARECTLAFAGSYSSQVAAAWDAVGVPSRSSTSAAAAAVAKCLAKIQKVCKCGESGTCWKTVAVNQCLSGRTQNTKFITAVKKSWMKFCSTR
jgi:Thermolysin metallopeptidase, alpha-helical domain